MTIEQFNSAIVAFLATCKPDRAKNFYGEVLGLRLVSEDQFALAFDANGTPLRIQKVEKFEPQSFTALGWTVDDIRKAVSKLGKLGVRFERYSFMDQDELGIWQAPSGAKVAWFKDPDGNLLSLSEC
jgi:catechol 2,3-dioxygenase-like lactoylglutathione lyase family enzyme